MASYKCIIIDDEPLICQLIKKLGNWDDLDIEIAAICYDGETAVNEILLQKPDIVLSDIKVPVYNGIEIIEKIQNAGLNPLFIIISGYSQFEYAQRAIQLKAVDYLVKPIHKDKLNDALSRCCELLTAKSEYHATTEALADAHESLLWNDLYSKKFHCENAADFKEQYGTFWSDYNHYTVTICISRPELSENHPLYIDRVISIFSTVFEQKTYFCDSSYGCINLIFPLPDDRNQHIDTLFQKLFIEIKQLKETLNSFSLTIGYSQVFLSPADLPVSLKQAWIAADYRFESGSDAIYGFYNLPSYTSSYSSLINETFINNLIYFSGNLYIEQIISALEEYKTNFLKQEVHDYIGLIDFGFLIINTIMSTTQYPEQEVLHERFLHDYHFCISYDDFFQLLTDYAATVIAQKSNQDSTELSASVKAAKDYIDKHYKEKIYLDDLAKEVCLSSTYLSAIFKKELNINITEYINSVRCDVAKNQLKTTVFSINTIAENAGYADEKYFQHQFKKIVGITPAQFRRIYS